MQQEEGESSSSRSPEQHSTGENMAVNKYNKYLGTIAQHGMIGITLALGQDLGLIKAMCDATVPLTSEELAVKLGLNERYTREWLSCMAAGDVIKIELGTNRFYVPEVNKSALTAKASFFPCIFHCSDSRFELMKCFQTSAPSGLMYHDRDDYFKWLHTWRETVSPHMIDTKILVYLDKRGYLERLESGIDVLDLCCGTGTFTREMAKRFPNSRFTGLDISVCALDIALNDTQKDGLTNIKFIKGDAMDLPENMSASFDLVMFIDAAHDLPDPSKAFEQVHRVLREGGLFNLIEFNVHSDPADNAGNGMAAMLYACSLYVCIMNSYAMKPHIGYGACWGVERIQTCLQDAKFKPADDEDPVTKGMQVYFFYKKM